jgi:Fe-S cluster biosynthesis and repair protein YggX
VLGSPQARDRREATPIAAQTLHFPQRSAESPMSRTVHCRRYGEQLEGLDRPPLPGPKGQEIFETVSKRAWSEWQALQTMLINEKHLRLIDKEARQYLSVQMERFLNNEPTDHAEGYVAPEDRPSPSG